MTPDKLPRVRTKQGTREAIARLMADGKERTAQEMAERLKSTPRNIGNHIRKMGGFTKSRINVEGEHLTTWRRAAE